MRSKLANSNRKGQGIIQFFIIAFTLVVVVGALLPAIASTQHAVINNETEATGLDNTTEIVVGLIAFMFVIAIINYIVSGRDQQQVVIRQ